MTGHAPACSTRGADAPHPSPHPSLPRVCGPAVPRLLGVTGRPARCDGLLLSMLFRRWMPMSFAGETCHEALAIFESLAN